MNHTAETIATLETSLAPLRRRCHRWREPFRCISAGAIPWVTMSNMHMISHHAIKDVILRELRRNGALKVSSAALRQSDTPSTMSAAFRWLMKIAAQYLTASFLA